ncbi:MAG: hypothetical protein IKD62_00525 [Oscillospiraceae bacterium]|nr:hypothetical protein [Oscillospiraceae bacterium]
MAYKKKTDLAAEYDISASTVHRIYKLIQEQLGKRYRRDVIIQTGTLIRIDEDVFRDALANRELIIRGIAPKYRRYAT